MACQAITSSTPSGTEVQLSDPKLLRAPSIHKVMMEHGERVLCVTAKDKLRRLLAHGGVPATSAEKAHECPLPAYGIETSWRSLAAAIQAPTNGI